MTIGKKLFLLIFVSVILCAGGLLTTIHLYQTLLDKNAGRLQPNQEAIIVREIQFNLQCYNSNSDRKYLDNLNQLIKNLSDLVEQEYQSALNTGDQNIIAVAGTTRQTMAEITAGIPALRKNPEVYQKLIRFSIPALSRQSEEYLKLESAAAAENTRQTNLFIFITAGAAIALLIISSLLIARRIARPASQITRTISEIASADLTKKIQAGSKDEIGRLVETFNNMVDRQADLAKKVNVFSEKISEAAAGFASSANELTIAANRIDESIGGISRGASAQALQVDKTAKIVEQMNISVSRIVNLSEITDRKTSLAVELGQKGSDATHDTIGKMQEIKQAVNTSSEQIKNLGALSEQIGQMIELINKITEQTNILALNTSIEAARAGEEASGFAAVAEDVQKLAESTSNTISQITKIIKDIQLQTSKAVEKMGTVTAEVSGGVEVVDKTGRAIDDMMNVVREVRSLSGEIVKLTQEQTQACGNIRQAIASIARIAEENVRLTESAGESTKDQSGLTAEISDAAAKLTHLSDQLSGTVKNS